ncbi:MAG: DUF5320 family protein [Thermodesulfobacteriota bacterium]|nr:DUF5320 family protein [Thermodesulfobacteriota bacterium]
MPRMDGTGPAGTGTPGRGLGPCGKGIGAQPGRFTSVQDNFRGRGRGGGFGRGRRQRRRISFAGFSGNDQGNN